MNRVRIELVKALTSLSKGTRHRSAIANKYRAKTNSEIHKYPEVLRAPAKRWGFLHSYPNSLYPPAFLKPLRPSQSRTEPFPRIHDPFWSDAESFLSNLGRRAKWTCSKLCYS